MPSEGTSSVQSKVYLYFSLLFSRQAGSCREEVTRVSATRVRIPVGWTAAPLFSVFGGEWARTDEALRRNITPTPREIYEIYTYASFGLRIQYFG